MATAVNQINFSSTSNLSSYTTGSRTPTANRFSIVNVISTQNGGTSPVPTVSGNGLTYSQVGSTLYNTTTTALRRVTMFVAKNGASPSAGAITADFGGTGQVGCLIFVDEIDGLDLTGTALQAIVQSKAGSVDSSGGSETITLDSAITAGNASYGCIAHQANEGHTPGDGHTEMADNAHDSPVNSACTLFKATGSQTVSASWSTTGRRGGIAVELKAAASGHTVTANQAAETDTAQPIARSKARALAQVAETDTAQAITADKIRTLGQPAETDAAQPISAKPIRLISQAAETDTAQPISADKTRALAQAAETDTAQPITADKTRALGQVAETDQAQPITADKTLALGQVAETDQAQAITEAGAGTINGTVNQAAETDAAQPITSSKIRALGQVAETDAAQPITADKILALGQVAETDQAQPITEAGAISRTVDQAAETDLVQAITSRKIRALGQVAETAQALAITPARRHQLGLAFELDMAQPLSSRKIRIVGMAAETDLALAILFQLEIGRSVLTTHSTARRQVHETPERFTHQTPRIEVHEI